MSIPNSPATGLSVFLPEATGRQRPGSCETELLAAQLRGRCLIDFARLHVLMRNEVPNLIRSLGVESIAFGSHMPFDYVGPSLVKLANLATLPAGDYERITWRNAAEFFGLEVSDEGTTGG